MIISFQHTSLRDVFHIDLSASLKQTRGCVVIQFTMCWAAGLCQGLEGTDPAVCETRWWARCC